jgi:hypothetical protein
MRPFPTGSVNLHKWSNSTKLLPSQNVENRYISAMALAMLTGTVAVNVFPTTQNMASPEGDDEDEGGGQYNCTACR